MNYSVIESCIEKVITKQSETMVNKYILFYNSNIINFSLYKLDTLYFYLIYAHKKQIIDIFEDNNKIFVHLFLML
jgi:hypothetical protein